MVGATREFSLLLVQQKKPHPTSKGPWENQPNFLQCQKLVIKWEQVLNKGQGHCRRPFAASPALGCWTWDGDTLSES